jgi:diaminohydroxyphosphoribosylaminopyrimidine deaminase/5-amino-6-(5-phosphoribosylamino)uracil reductase
VARLEAAGAVVVQMPGLDGHVDLNALMQDLAELQINDVLVEAGPTLNGGLLAAGLLDELVVYQAPKIMGSNARGMFAMGAIEAMSESIELELVETRRVGNDLRLTYRNNN